MLPDLRLGALLEHDQGAPGQRLAVPLERQRDLDRLLQPHPRTHVDEDAVAPARVVAGDEGVPGRRQSTEPSLGQLRMGLGGLCQRQHYRSLGSLNRGADRARLIRVEVEA